MPFEEGIWTYSLLAYDNDEQQYNTFCFDYYLVGDTIVNNKEYHIMQTSYGMLNGFFREENSSVFYVPLPESDYQWNENLEEFMVFDFSLEVGDTAKIYAFGFDYYHFWELEVNSVNLIEVGGTMRKQILFGAAPNDFPYTGCQFRWIEGIGETQRTPFYFWPSGYDCITNEAQLSFDCLELNGENIIGSCNCVDSTPTTEVFEEQIKIFPNPSSRIFQISIPENSDFEIEVFDYQGKSIQKIMELEIDLFTFPSGIYFVKLKWKEHFLTQKILKF